MKIAAIVSALVDAGATPQMILAAVKSAEEQKDAAADASRDKARARVAKWRANHAGNVTKRSETPRNGLRASGAPVEDKTLTSVIEPQEKKESKVRACRLPTDFQPDTSWAISQGLSPSQADTEAAKFRDYWSSKGSNATKTDWPATWRNWVRQSLERRPTGPPAALQAPTMSQLFQAVRDKPDEDQPGPQEDRSGVRQAVSYLSAVRTG